MPIIKSSAELRNSYSEVSDQCHQYGEPIYITKNGKGDLAVMSIEAYEQMAGRLELYSLMQEGLEDIKSGSTVSLKEVMRSLKQSSNGSGDSNDL